MSLKDADMCLCMYLTGLHVLYTVFLVTVVCDAEMKRQEHALLL
jgi:hypothetical protein